MTRPGAWIIATAALALAAHPAAAGASGFWSLLPVGQGQTVDAAGIGAFAGAGTVPPSFESQRALFEAMPAAAPGVATADLGRFLKPAPLTLSAADAVSTELPRAGVTIRRDAFSVPYVDGVTREDVMWGAGWVAGEDRLFSMDAVRLTAQGRLTTLIGPGEHGEVAAADAEQLGVTDYRPAELTAQVQQLRASSPEGAAAVADLTAYLAGLNAYIDHARSEPRAMPGEYPALGRTPQPWSLEDLVSVAGLITGYFGRGGGVEIDDAEAYSAARARFGRRRGDAHDRRLPRLRRPRGAGDDHQALPLRQPRQAARPGLGDPRPRLGRAAAARPARGRLGHGGEPRRRAVAARDALARRAGPAAPRLQRDGDRRPGLGVGDGHALRQPAGGLLRPAAVPRGRAARPRHRGARRRARRHSGRWSSSAAAPAMRGRSPPPRATTPTSSPSASASPTAAHRRPPRCTTATRASAARWRPSTTR